MNSRQFFHSPLVPLAALCLLLVPVACLPEILPEDGPADSYSQPDRPQAPWAELPADLPAWPDNLNRLIELNVSTEGLGYKLYLDPASLATGDDRVVRYTAVLISPSGIWNVNYEGLHCGERKYRRFAYGNDGTWRQLRDSPWKPVTGLGVDQYRKLLYENYLCDTTAEYRDADELVRKLRYGNPTIYE